MKLEEIRLVGDTDSSGNATIKSEQSVFGFIDKLIWVEDELANNADGVLSVINPSSGVVETLFTFTDVNADTPFYPRTLVHGLTKTALTGTAGGDRTRLLVSGDLQLVISNGGSTNNGGCIAYVLEND